MFLLIPSLALLFTTLSPMVVRAQDANCSAVYNDFTPSPTLKGLYQKCYIDQLFNAALVAEGIDPDYNQVLTRICTKPAACSQSTLTEATHQYITACAASIDAEAVNGDILQTGKNALEIFFADPIRSIYCTLDPNPSSTSPPPPPPPPPPALPAVLPPSYCLAKAVPSSSQTPRFTTHLVLYLTSGAIRANQRPFFEALDVADTCSICSQLALKESVTFLAENVMPRIGPNYTPGFVQYWTQLVAAYNAQCKTAIVQEWPEGTLNETIVQGLTPTGASPSAPNTTLPSASATTTGSTHPHARSGATTDMEWMSLSSIAVLVGSILIAGAL
ncbi:hypothetical protein BGZ75_000023 [Mortierella antarctica]|nr:hypothetical protein BGZ75_000023 [Mortierella antarctica]